MGKILDYLDTIRNEWTPGSIDPREGQMLYAMVRNQQPLRLIEIGRSTGYSTLWIAAAVEDNGVGILVTIDRISEPHCEEQAQKRFIESGADRFVRSLVVPSLEAAYEKLADEFGFHGFYDFLFLDGSHHPKAVQADLKAWLPMMAPYGMLVAHDTIKFGGDELQVVNRRRGDTMEVFQRASPGSVIRMLIKQDGMPGFSAMTLETSRGMTIIRREGSL